MLTIAINGFGRIGRHAFKVISAREDLRVVAINDLTDTKTLAHLLQYDTAYPDFEKKVTYDDTALYIDDQKIAAFAQKDPAALPWRDLNIDIVLECTGVFLTREKAAAHIAAGAKRVIISAPAKDDSVNTYLCGVNEHAYSGEEIIDNASCTTNSLAPVMQVLNETFGVEKGFITTIHSYTADQNLQDGPHKDLRRARAAAQNIVPTTTGAAIATTKVIPEIQGMFDGMAVRVPTITVSLTDFTLVMKQDVTVESINDALVHASKNQLQGILACTDIPLVSSDFIGDAHSCTVDLPLTKVLGGNLVKVVAWYDNEWGYAHRLVDLAGQIGATL